MSWFPIKLLHAKATPRRLGSDPARDWWIIVAIAFAALILIVGWNAWTFRTVVLGGTVGEPAPPSAAVPTSSALDTIDTLLTTRAAEDTKYEDGTYQFADPSQ